MTPFRTTLSALFILLTVAYPFSSFAKEDCSGTALLSDEQLLNKALQEVSQDPESQYEHSYSSVLKILKHVQDLRPELLEKCEAVTLFRFSPEWIAGATSSKGGILAPDLGTPNLVLTGLRDIRAKDVKSHTILVFKGPNGHVVFDAHFSNESQGVREAEYLRKMFLSSDQIKTAITHGTTAPAKEREKDKLRRYVFANEPQMLTELRARAIDAATFIASYHDTFFQHMKYSNFAIWFDSEHAFPSVSVAQYQRETRLSLSALPDGKYWKSHWIHLEDNEAPPYAEYDSGIAVYAHPENLSLGETEQIANAVTLSAPYFQHPERFNRTDRDIEVLKKAFFPESFLNWKELAGRVVVDMASGGGLAVEEMRLHNVYAYGVEVALSPRGRSLMLFDTSKANPNRFQSVHLTASLDTKPFIQADMSDLRIADMQADFIFETYGVFDYLFYGAKNNSRIKAYLSKVISEWTRILKIGGKIRISNIGRQEMKELESFFAAFTDLTPPRFVSMNLKDEPSRGAIELIRIK